MRRHFKPVSLPLLLLAVWPCAAFAAASPMGAQDARAVVGLIRYLYAGYDNGANDRKSFFETVPWDIETGRLIDRIAQCERKEGAVIDMDWPSDSQDPQIRKLSVVYSGSPSPKHATVRASFQSYDTQVTIDYDMYLYNDTPRRWGVSNMRIHDKNGTDDLLKTVHQALKDECKGF
jgi:hypothetical protein